MQNCARRNPQYVRAVLVRAFTCFLSVVSVGAQQATADDLPPHPPANVHVVYDETDGTVGIDWDRSTGALRYEVRENGNVVYSAGWETGATLVATTGAHAYTVHACNKQCGDSTAALSVTVGTDVPPSGIRYGGGFSDIVWTPNAENEPGAPYQYGEIHATRGAYRASDTDVRTLGGSATVGLLTAFESDGPSGATALSGRFFMISGTGSAVERFSLSFGTDKPNLAAHKAGFFIATWDRISGWQARNDLGAAESFTPLTTDVVIAIGYRGATSDGIDTLKALVPDSPVPAGIRYGEGESDIVILANKYLPGNKNYPGEMRISDGVYRLPDGTERRLRANRLHTVLITPFEPRGVSGSDNSTGRFYVISGAVSARNRFSLQFQDNAAFRAVLDAGFFVADWDAELGWRATTNRAQREAFVPQKTDVVVAMGHRATGDSPGIDGLKLLVPRASLSARAQVLTTDYDEDRLYRLELSRNLVTDAVDLGSIAPIKDSTGIARVADGVALVVDWKVGHLYRVEYTNDAVTSVTDLGDVGELAGRETFTPKSVAHEAPGAVLIGDDASNQLYRVEYDATAVTAATRLGYLSPSPLGLAPLRPGAFLLADHSRDKIYRLDFNDAGFKTVSLGGVDDLSAALGLAVVSDGVAVAVQDSNPDDLFRIEFSDKRIVRRYNLGDVNGLRGFSALTALPPVAPGANAAPTAQNDDVVAIQDTPVAVDVLANDSDAEGHALTVASVTQPTNGTAAVQSDGSVAYTPNAAFTGEDSFSYTVSDGFAQATATVTVTVKTRPLANYDPDANTITFGDPSLIGHDSYEIEETYKSSETATPEVTVYPSLNPQHTNAMPKSGIYSYRIRYYNKGLAGEWSISHTVTVSVPSMFTDGPAVETDTVPGTLAYDVGVTKGGQAYVNIPVQPVPGVNGLEPRLSIDYSSGRERQRVSDRLPGDVLGYGWRVSGLSAIRRCLKNRSSTTAIVFGITDGLCLDGEPLVRIVKEDDEESDAESSSDEQPADNPFAAGTEYRTYRESYAKIVVRQDTDSGDPWFEVFYPDGRRAEYGSTDDSRLRLADGGVIRTAPFLWSVKVVRDAYGNEMTHHYHEDETNGVRHPLKIVYGADGDAEVRFRYASRQDGGAVTMGSQTLTENVLLHTVEVRLGSGPVREYRLVSETTDSGWRRLDKVQLCGYDERGSKSDCLTPMDFDWMVPQSAPAGYKTFVEGFSDPLGRVTTFEHKTITETGVQFTEKPFGDPVAPDSDSAQVDGVAKPVVIAMVRGDGIDGKHRTEYAYYGKGFLSNYHWGFLGFYATRVTDTSSGVVTYFQYRLDAPHYARISTVHQYDGAYDPNDSALEILSKQLTLHEAQLFGKGAGKERHVPYVKQRTELLYEGGTGLGAKQTEQAMTFDSDGLLTRTVRTTKYGVGALETTRTPPTVWGGVPAYKFDKKTVHTSTSTVDLRNRTGSMSDVSQWLIGFTCREVLEESLTERTAEPLRRRWATYAAHGNTLDVASVTRLGASTGSDCPMETNDPTYPAISSLELTHTYGYDANGNLTSAGVNANATGHVAARSATATMFADKRYPQRLTNAEMHAESRTYDVRFGLPKSTTDPNGQTISRAYDPFGRVVRHTTRDGVAVNTRHLWCGTDLTCARMDNVDPVMAVETNSTIGPRTVTYLDSLGRRVRTETESFDGSTVDRQDIVYDDLGRVYRASVPYESSGSVAAKVHETEYDYDIRDRVEKLNRPDGGTVNTTRLACIDQVKEIAKETVYDEAGTEVAIRTRVSRYNLMGELVRVTEGGGTAAEDCNTPTGLTDAVTTDYIYYSSGQLKTVSVKAANSQTSKTVASFDYDAAGNRKQAIRPDTGQIDFTPTALGELHKRAHVKPSDLAVTYSYDKLGRITKAKDSSGSSHWVYDGATNGTGSLSRRCRMADASAMGCSTSAVFDETYAYNGQARLRLTTTKIKSGMTTRTFTQTNTYDSNGRLSTRTFPSGLTARYEYNARGYPYRVLDHGNSKELVAHVDRDAWGNVTRQRLRNGAFVTRTFDPATGREKRRDALLKEKLRHDALYDWRTDGLLKKRSVRGVLDDGTTTGFREESFTHDGLGRLTQAAATSGTTTRTLTMDHDVLGNLKFRMSDVTGDIDVTDYTYTDALNAVQYAKVGSTRQKYAYDDAGRMMSDRQCLQLTGTCTFSTQTDALNDRYIDWDGRDLATKIVVGSGLTDSTPTARETFRYGPDVARFERFSEWKDGEETQSMRTFYVGDYEKTFPESDADVVSVERTRLPGGVVHVKTTPATGTATEAFEYRHVDHLGSAAVIADGTATPLAVLGNDPFGGRRRADWTRELTADESAALSGRRTARGFTGHEHLDRTGFVHMNGRLYDPRLGRFLSPDPYVTDPTMSQDWNAYSYVSNSPMSFADPTGHVRAGPGCDLLTVMCAANDPGGGHSVISEPYQISGSFRLTIPILTVDWGFVGGWGHGSDYGWGGWFPTVRVGVASFPVSFVVPGYLHVEGVGPADEPIPILVVTPALERPGDYIGVFDELDELWNRGGILGYAT